jgi:hypothetical protein
VNSDLPGATAPGGGLVVSAKLTDSRQGTMEAEPTGTGDDRAVLLTVRFSQDTALLRVRLQLLGSKRGPLERYDDVLTGNAGAKAGEEKRIRVPLRTWPSGRYRIEVQPCTTGRNCGGEMTFVSNCRGPRGCRIAGGTTLCDQSIADIGDACTGDGAACSLDGLNLLVCRDGRCTLKSACTAGCEASSRKRLSCHGEGVTP